MCFTDIFWSVSENLWFSTSLKSLEHGTYHRSAEFRIKNSTAVIQSCSVKTWLNLQELHLYQSLFFNEVSGLIPATLWKKRLAQVFFCEFCETFKNTFLHWAPLVAASDTFLALYHKICVFFIFISFFDDLSNLRNRKWL